MNRLPEQVICNILLSQMNLSDDQVWIRDQNKVIPADNRIYIIVGMVDTQVLSVVNTPDPTYLGMEELLQVVSKENIQIDFLSRDTSALFRRYEILTALSSIYSEQQQEAEEFRIFPLPTSFTNTSSAEGGSNINRFSIIIACHTWFRQEKVLQSPNDYFDDFATRVDDEATINQPTGLIEFEIKGA